MSARALLDWCPLCGEKLPDDFVITRWMHDRICHPGYLLMQNGVDECQHDKKTHYVIIHVDAALPNYHLEFCDECHSKIPRDCIVKENSLSEMNMEDL